MGVFFKKGLEKNKKYPFFVVYSTANTVSGMAVG